MADKTQNRRPGDRTKGGMANQKSAEEFRRQHENDDNPGIEYPRPRANPPPHHPSPQENLTGPKKFR